MTGSGLGDPSAFTFAANWSGGFYQLALELGETNDARLQRALSALWLSAELEGCYRSTECEPDYQDEVPCNVESLVESGHLYATVQLPDSVRVVCGCVAVREEEDQIDWLVFYIPVGALGRVPTGLRRQTIDGWLADVGKQIYREVEFRLALIGFEVSGHVYSEQLQGSPPEERWEGYLLPLACDLRYVPANR